MIRKLLSFPYQPKRLFTAFLLLPLVFLCSCQNKKDRILKNEKHFEKIFLEILDQKLHYGKKKAYATLDSIKKNDPKVNLLFDFIYYRFYAGEYFNERSLDTSLYYAHKLLPILKKIGNEKDLPSKYSLAYYTLSDIYYAKKQYLTAYKYLYLGKNTSGSNYISLSEYNYRIGMILYNQGDYLLAAHNFKDAFKGAEKDSTFERIYRCQEILSNTGLSYYKANRLDSATFWYTKTLAYLSKAKLSPDKKHLLDGAKGVVLGNLAQVYAKKEDFEPAISLYKQSIAVNDNSVDLKHDAFLQKIHLAEAYLKTSDYKFAETLISEIERTIGLYPSKKSAADLLAIKSAYYSKRGDSKNALNYLNQSIQLNNAYLDEQKLLTHVNIIDQLRVIENQNKLELLKKENELKSIYLTSSFILVAFCIIILFLVYQNFSKSKKTVKTLNSLNQTINEQANELKTKNLEKDKLIRVVAHDLRNPIGSIISISRLLQLEQDIKESDRELIKMAENTATDALNLISEILETQHQDNVQLFLNPISVNHILKQASGLLSFKTEEKQQLLKIELLPEDVRIFGNREQISRVLTNLVTNASKFSDTHKEIKISTKTQEGFVYISVKDEGVGINSDGNEVCITDLSLNKRTGTLGEKSFGMGLTICKNIIDQHKGFIWYESDRLGTTFHIKLPIYTS